MVTRLYLHHLRLPRAIPGLVIRYVEWLIGSRFEAIAPINTGCRIACPVLVVHRRDDETVPMDDAHRIAARRHAPEVRLLVIPGAGHGSTDQIQGYGGGSLRFLDASWAARA